MLKRGLNITRLIEEGGTAGLDVGDSRAEHGLTRDQSLGTDGLMVGDPVRGNQC